MPWYLVYCNHGGGHQSHNEFYHWSDTKLTKEEKSELWHEHFDNLSWPIGDVTLLKGLPADVRQRKIESVKKQLAEFEAEKEKAKKYLQDRLKLLRKTEALSCSHEYYKSDYVTTKEKRSLLSTCGFCGATREYGKKWRKPRKSVTLLK